MPEIGQQKEKSKILEELYDGNIPIKEPRKTVKEYFSDPKVVDRWIAGGVLFFSLAALSLGFFQFRYKLSSYFKVSDVQLGLTNTPTNNQDLLGLREKDTDQDGINDYDEFYVYQTSPYLPDSDSDGIKDAAEIAANTDPNCKQGDNCFSSNEQAVGAQDSQNLEDLAIRGQITAPQIRQLLLEAGAPAEEVNQLSDEDLLIQYQQLLTQSQGGVNLQPQTITLPDGNLEDLTPTEIRQLLLDQGIAPSILDAISDAELIDLVNETLSN